MVTSREVCFPLKANNTSNYMDVRGGKRKASFFKKKTGNAAQILLHLTLATISARRYF